MARRRYARSRPRRRSRSRRSRNSNFSHGFLAVGLVFIGVALYLLAGDRGLAGFATTQNTGLNITIGNIAPFIDDIENLAAVDPLEASLKNVTFTFNATDLDGGGQLTSPSGRFNMTGEAVRRNDTCTELAVINSTSRQYECTVGLWYFDSSGTWTVNATIFDINGAFDTLQETFTYNQLVSLVISPANLTWPSLQVTDQNSTSNNDPTTVNNTGNANNNVSVTAQDLYGEVTPADRLNAVNFTTSVLTGGGACSGVTCKECGGLNMTNGSAVFIDNATLPRGNFSVIDSITGKEHLYYCLTEINNSISAQSYSTSFLGPWVVTASSV